MLMKFITCIVKPENRVQFNQGQELWSEISTCEGFLGLTGGWSVVSRRDRAVIISAWENKAAYDKFMATKHEKLFLESGQKSICDSLETSLWDVSVDVRADFQNVPRAISKGRLLRVDLFDVPTASKREFLEFVEEGWIARIRAADGSLTSGIGREVGIPSEDHKRFLIVSLWYSQLDHDRLMYGGPIWWHYWKVHFEQMHEKWTYHVAPVLPQWLVKHG